jgi:predicted Zn-dependent peptidase
MYELTALDNGLRILTVHMPHLRSVSFGFFMGVGSRFESEPLAGASHFIEHMLFKGTTRRPTAKEIVEAIEARGGMFNASTGLETTLFWAKVAASYLPEALDVVSDMLLHATFDPTEMEKERAVIAEEINYTLDAPDSLSQMIVNRLQWPDHPLGRDIAGPRESVANLSRASLLAYMADHYCPNEVILGMAGLVDHKEVVDWATDHLSEWKAKSPVLWEPAPPDHHGPSLHVEYKDTEQAHLSFSFSALARSDPQRHALRLLNVVLGEGMRSRLFQEVRERLGLAYEVDSFISTLQDTGSVGIYAGVAADQAEAAICAILEQLERLRDEPLSEDELQKAKEFVEGRLMLTLEDSFAVAALYARQELLGPEVLGPEETKLRFDAVQAADIEQLAQNLFQENRLNLAVVGPFSGNGDRFRQAIQF